MTMTASHHRRAVILALLFFTAQAGARSAVPGLTGRQIAFEAVVANLKVGDPRVRLDALYLLRDSGFLEAAVPVAVLLSDSVSDVQVLAIDVEVKLFLVDEAYTRAITKTLAKQSGATLPLLAFAQGPGAVIANPAPAAVLNGLVAAMTSPMLQVRYDAAYALGLLAPAAIARGQFPEGKAAVGGLMVLVKDPNGSVRLAATHVLGRLLGAALQNPKANAGLLETKAEMGDHIISGMNDPDELIRLSSMGVVGEIRYDRAVQSLTDLVGYYKRDKNGMAALDALAHIAHPSSISVFTGLYDGDNERVRALAVDGIGRTGDAAAMNSLQIRAAKERSDVVKQALAFAKARNGDFSGLASIVEGFRRDDLQARTFDYLVELGAPIAPSLAGYATHQDAKIRAGVIEVLGIIGNQASLATIEALISDKDRLVSSAARRSQKRLAVRLPLTPRIS